MESTFQEVAELWLGNIRCRVKESTYAKYANVVRKHLIPALGNCQDGELTTRQAEEMVRRELGLDLMTEEEAEKISEKTMGDILMVLKEILSYGELLGYHTPCRLELLHLKKKEKKAVVLERQSQIKLEAFLLGEKDPVRTGILLSLYMGIRLGEICALKRKHVFYEEGILRIHATMQRVQAAEAEKGPKTKIVITEPKSFHSIREIPIPSFLLEHMEYMRSYPEEAYLLTGSETCFMEPRNLQNHFRKYQEACRLRPVNFHALRHTFATRCIESGVDIKALSEILGHASVNITLNRYVHSSLEMKRRNMEKVRPLCRSDKVTEEVSPILADSQKKYNDGEKRQRNRNLPVDKWEKEC